MSKRNTNIPQDIEAEKALLGSMMLGGLETVGRVIELLPQDQSDAFYLSEHRRIFDSMCAMCAAREKIDLITMRNRLQKMEAWSEVGGEQYVIELAESVPSHHNAEHYAQIVIEKYQLRSLLYLGHTLSEKVCEPTADSMELSQEAASQLHQISSGSFCVTPLEDVGDTLEKVIADIESRDDQATTFWPTRFENIDDIILGVSPGDLIVIAARSSMGKSALALNVAWNMASPEPRFSVGYISLEMSKDRLVLRLLARLTGIDLKDLRGARAKDKDTLREIKRYREEIRRSPLVIVDTDGRGNVRTLRYLVAIIRNLVRMKACRAIFIDYLQLLDVPELKREERHFRVQYMTSRLKEIAIELGIAIFLVCQLNRLAAAGGGDNRPNMSQLRESGSVEQDADMIWLVHRPAYYDKHLGPKLQQYAEVIIEKNRDGKTGVAALSWSGARQRFSDMGAEDAKICAAATTEKTKPSRSVSQRRFESRELDEQGVLCETSEGQYEHREAAAPF